MQTSLARLIHLFIFYGAFVWLSGAAFPEEGKTLDLRKGVASHALFLSGTQSNEKCEYRVSGKLFVKHLPNNVDELGAESSLEGVQVRLSGRRKIPVGWGTWSAWTTKRTKRDGGFTFNVGKSCAKRQLRIDVKFDHPDLEIRHGRSTSSTTNVKWYTIYKSGELEKRDVQLAARTFKFGSAGPEALGDKEPRTHAEIWTVYRRAIDYLASYGRHLAFRNKVKVKYPGDGAGNSDYANPFTQIVYLFESSDDDIGTQLHELMHIWAYQHTGGEAGMAAYLATHLKEGTDDLVGKPQVAFHEGFAIWAEDMLRNKFFGTDHDEPFRRDWNPRVISPATIERHAMGWWSLFNLLEQRRLWEYDFYGSEECREEERDGPLANVLGPKRVGCRLKRLPEAIDRRAAGKNCRVTRITFRELLDSISGMRWKEMNHDGFFKAVRRSQSDFGAREERVYRSLVDPNATANQIYGVLCQAGAEPAAADAAPSSAQSTRSDAASRAPQNECSHDSDCSVNQFCHSAGRNDCRPRFGIGHFCTRGAQCESGRCLVGFCRPEISTPSASTTPRCPNGYAYQTRNPLNKDRCVKDVVRRAAAKCRLLPTDRSKNWFVRLRTGRDECASRKGKKPKTVSCPRGFTYKINNGRDSCEATKRQYRIPSCPSGYKYRSQRGKDLCVK